MNDQPDIDLVFQVQKNNDEAALMELIDRHSGIYVDMVRRFGSQSLTDDQLYVIMGEKDMNIYQAAKEYKPEKSKFSTYLANKARYLCLAGRTKNQKSPHFVDFESECFHIESDCLSPQEETENKEFNSFFDKVQDLIKNHPDQRVKEVFEQRYFSKTNGSVTSWRDISKAMGLSIQGVINIHNRTLPELKKQIKQFTNEQITF